MIKAEVLFINNKRKLFFLFGDFIKNIKKPKPVVKKKISKIKRPLEASDAKECTLVKIPDLTKNVPKTLKEKQSIDRKTTHLSIACSPLIIIRECTNAKPTIQGISEIFSTGSQNPKTPKPQNPFYLKIQSFP